MSISRYNSTQRSHLLWKCFEGSIVGFIQIIYQLCRIWWFHWGSIFLSSWHESASGQSNIFILDPIPSASWCYHLIIYIHHYDLDNLLLRSQPLLVDVRNTNMNFILEPILDSNIPNSNASYLSYWLLYKTCLAPSNIGTAVCHIDYTVPPLQPDNFSNIFEGLFGINFPFKDNTLCYESGHDYGLSLTYNKPVCPKYTNYNVLHDGFQVKLCSLYWIIVSTIICYVVIP